MAEIAQAYFHLKGIHLSEPSLREVGDRVSYMAAEFASGKFPPETLVDVRLSEGSLKGWIGLGAAALMAYGTIADYKGFKESISEIVSDGRYFSSALLDAVPKIPELGGARVYRMERRTRTPGRIKRLIERRERLESNRRELPTHVARQEDIEIEHLLQQILVEIDPSERRVLRKLLGEENPSIPIQESSRVAIRSQRSTQVPMFGGLMGAVGDPPADYIRRFLLSDGPTGGALVRSQKHGLLIPPPEPQP